jgi:DNA (cytosine-5)-methyltransferase 1
MGFNDSALTAFDFFAGGGGASLGLHRAGINMLAALNHSPVAIATHEANFPGAKHMLCDIRVQRSWGLGQADIMWASPDCTHHSIAKGGQSRDAKERALAEELPRFAYNLNVNCIMVENVKEFLDWGPIMQVGDKMLPDRTRKGEYYRAWVASLAELGFVNYEYRLLNSADFGVPQSRVRYFGIFTRKGVAINWPVPTHDKHGRSDLPKWTAVRTVLDLGDKGRSIFTEWGKPIADKTLRRILAGLRKHVIGAGAGQFLDKRSSNHPSGKPNSGASVDNSAPTVATCYLPDLVTPRFLVNPAWGGASSSEHGTAPVVVARQDKGPLSVATAHMLHNYGGVNRNRSLSEPAATITTTGGGQYLVHHYSGGGQSSSLSMPHPASTCNPHGRLVTPVFLAQYNGGSDNCRVLSIDGATNTVPTENRFAAVQCLMQANGTRPNDDAARLTKPLAAQAPTLNTNGGNLYLMSYYGNGTVQPVCRPCPTLRTHDCAALLGFVTGGHGCNPPYPFSRPAKTIVASRRHQYLVLAAPGSPVAPMPEDSEAMSELKTVCRENGIADIYMRMLKVSELKLIMGFPADYHLAGSATKQKEMLGNAVVPQVSEAIARAMVPSLLAARLRKLPKLRREAVNRYEQAELFGFGVMSKEVAA